VSLRGNWCGLHNAPATLLTWAFCLALLVTAACSSTPTPVACGPFGDPPAKVTAIIKPDCGKDGELLGPWTDGDGNHRYACLYEPAAANRDHKLPLIVFLHPSLFPAGSVVQTGLLDLRETYPLSGDPKRPGFIVLAPQGRKTTHYYPAPDDRGIGWDNWYRQFDPKGDVNVRGVTYWENADAATIDHFLARELASGKVDSRRVYLSGWSNGAAMASLYALNRHDVAAAAVYSAPDPFGAFEDSCQQTPVAGPPASNAEIRIFNPGLALMHVHNSCDLAGLCPNAEKAAKELRAAGVNLRDVILDAAGEETAACSSHCGTNSNGDTSFWRNPWGYTEGLRHHMKWPRKWNPAMLDFLRDHPLAEAKSVHASLP
jgi:predicted esterase